MRISDKNDEPISLLLVESCSISRIGIREVLSSFKNIVIVGEADTLSNTFNLTQNYKPDIILMNFYTLGENIQSSMEKIKKISQDTKIIVLTEHNSSNVVMSVLSSGANAYCNKNISPDTLSVVIRNVAKGVCWVDPEASETALNMFRHSNLHSKINVHLTSREKEVLKHLVNGDSNVEIARKLIVSVHTAKAHVCSLLQKLGVQDRVQAAVLAVKSNLV